MPDEAALRALAREAIRSANLPARKPDRVYGGAGTRVPCAVCGELITPDQSEMEVDFNRHGVQPGIDRHFLHVRCLAAWEFERTKMEGTST